MKSRNKSPLEQALAFFDRAEQKLDAPTPEGFFPVSAFAKAKGVSVSTMRCRLQKMVDAGLAEVVLGRVKPKNIQVRHYRLKP